MQKIETTVDASHVRVIEDRLRALGIERITALQVEELGEQATHRTQLTYRGVSASFSAKRVQLQVLADDVDADVVVDSLRALAKAGHARLDAILVYPVGTLTAIGVLNPGSGAKELQRDSVRRPAPCLEEAQKGPTGSELA